MIFESFFTISENILFKLFWKSDRSALRAPTNWTQRANTRPTGGPMTPHVSHTEREEDTGVHSSPAARSPARPKTPHEPHHACELNGTHAVANGARRVGHRRSWRNGGAGDRRPATSDHGTVGGRVLEHRWAKTNKMHVLEGKEVGRKGTVHRAKKLRRARLCSGEQFTWRGGLPRATEASTGCVMEERSSGLDGGVNGALRWSER
jgi:hypothetical protein